MSRFGSFLCRFMGGHQPSPVARLGSSRIVSECLRCGLPLVRWFPSPKGLPESPSGVLVWEGPPPTPAQFAALHLAWDQALGIRTLRSRKAPDTESASAPHGAGR